jgi:linoleoyl-CoA desaturase
MVSATLSFKKVKYEQKDSSDRLFAILKKKKGLYFSINHISRFGNRLLLLKAFALFLVVATCYYFVLTAGSYFMLQLSYLLLGAACVITGMNFGHDAAHNCLTGKRKWDSLLFELIFGLQGINGYLWKMRHNHSHHPYPNVHSIDSDLEAMAAFYLSPVQEKRWFHYYQHLYAPILYMFMSLIWIFYVDFKLFRQKNIGNLELVSHRPIEALKLVVSKIISLTIFLILPIQLSPLSATTVLVSFLVMHLINSMMLTFIFFISHHTMEISYQSPAQNVIRNSWLSQQIQATMDFHAESKIANFFFGGFNAHLAHHLFPEVCHIHYPVLSTLIRKTLAEHRIKYNTLGFFAGIRSHLKLLWDLPRRIDAGR